MTSEAGCRICEFYSLSGLKDHCVIEGSLNDLYLQKLDGEAWKYKPWAHVSLFQVLVIWVLIPSSQCSKNNQNAHRWKSNGAYFEQVRPFKELTSAERRAPERLASRESFRLLGFGGHGGRRFPDSGARARSRGSPRWPSSGPSKRSPPGTRRRQNTPSGPEKWSKNVELCAAVVWIVPST